MDWMMEVSSEFTLKRETYHLAINFVDRLLEAQKNVPKNEFQLVGLTCLYLASKIEEIYPPKIADFAKSADNGYTHD
jgi:cyclin E